MEADCMRVTAIFPARNFPHWREWAKSPDTHQDVHREVYGAAMEALDLNWRKDRIAILSVGPGEIRAEPFFSGNFLMPVRYIHYEDVDMRPGVDMGVIRSNPQVMVIKYNIAPSL